MFRICISGGPCSGKSSIQSVLTQKEAWIGHSHLRVFDNSTNFDGKIQRVLKELYNVLGIPVSILVQPSILSI